MTLLSFIKNDNLDIPLAFVPVREALMEHGIDAIDILFYYYMDANIHFDPWVNYLCACSAFPISELDDKRNRKTILRLEAYVKQLMVGDGKKIKM